MAKKRQGDLTEKAARMAASDVVQPEQQLDAAIAETLGPAVMAAGHGEMLLADEIMGPDSDAPLSAADTILAEAAVSAPGEVSGEGEKPVLADAGGPPAESPPAPEPASSADSQPAAASDEQGESPAVEGASAEDPPGEVPEEELNPLESLGVISAEELADAVNEAEAATEASAEPVTVTDEGIAAAPAAESGAQAVPPAAEGQAPEAALHQNPLTAPGLTEKLAENIARIETLSQRLLRAVAGKPMRAASIEGPGPELYGSVAQAWVKLATEQPARLIEQQVRYWGDTLRHVAEAQGAFLHGFQAPSGADTSDRRFKNPLWHTNPFYSFVMRQYQINAEAIRKAAADLQIDNEVERRRVDWFTRQMIDMLAPTNFLATNPDALVKALETEGDSLVRGLENLVRDIEESGGEMIVSLADRNAFRVGENIGTTPGEVVHRDRMFELIQYKPLTDQVHKAPLIVFPPWINKYYIMDLKPQNSLLRWLIEQGHTLFVVSWKNPDESFADVAMDDYVAAYLEAMDRALELTGERQLNAVGYCIGGTTLTATLGVLKQRGEDRVKSATFLTTLTDFSDQGEFTTFLQDDFVGGIEDEVARTGYLSAKLMQRTFSFLRANDLIWGPAIRSYMLGETPPAFDLLFWNGDGTNLPGRMVTQYLRKLCQANAMAREGFEILGHRVHLSDVTLPVCAIACESDHIAPWHHSWKGVAQMASPDRTFILSESGHIAGIINPPGKVKYGHYVSHADFTGAPEDWRGHARHHEGSWWPRWAEWLAQHSGPMVPAREPQLSLAPAPGTYVHETA